uniref:Beta-lactamase domain-containing protein n=1 Tax=Heterorhabditis bacteriophora TaxID=37862 RepID=A0A1I7X985_HETBA
MFMGTKWRFLLLLETVALTCVMILCPSQRREILSIITYQTIGYLISSVALHFQAMMVVSFYLCLNLAILFYFYFFSEIPIVIAFTCCFHQLVKYFFGLEDDSHVWRFAIQKLGLFTGFINLRSSKVIGVSASKVLSLAITFGLFYNHYTYVYLEQMAQEQEFYDPNTVDLMEWISKNTERDAIFTGSMQLMAGVKLCTGRRITNHPHFENKALRDRTRKLYMIYGRFSPDQIYRILREEYIDYFILEESICFQSSNGCSTKDLVDKAFGILPDSGGNTYGEMAPCRKSLISTEPLVALVAKGNRHRFFSSEIYLNVIFRMDRFREVFKLPDFGSRDFDGALVFEQDNYIYPITRNISPLIRKIFIALAKPYYKGSLNESTYQSALYDVIARKKPVNRSNPLGNDRENSDIHRLPTEVKIYLISLLLDLRVAKDESELVDGYYNASDLRILSFGTDSLHNSYYYFGDFRIFIETKQRQEYNSSCIDSDYVKKEWMWVLKEFRQCQFICLAEDRDEWKTVIDVLKSLNKCDRELSIYLQSLMDREQEKFNAELLRRTKIHNEETRLLAKKEMEILKELGMVRSSGRLQAKEIEKRKAEDERRRQIEEEQMACMEDITNGRPLRSPLKALRPITRSERISLRLAKTSHLDQQFQIQTHRNELTVSESCSMSECLDNNIHQNDSSNGSDFQIRSDDSGMGSESENKMKDSIEQPKRPRLTVPLPNLNIRDMKEKETGLQIESEIGIPIENIKDLRKKERNIGIESGVNAKPYICSPFYSSFRQGYFNQPLVNKFTDIFLICQLHEYECMLNELISPPNSTLSKLHVVEKLDIICGNEDFRNSIARNLKSVTIVLMFVFYQLVVKTRRVLRLIMSTHVQYLTDRTQFTMDYIENYMVYFVFPETVMAYILYLQYILILVLAVWLNTEKKTDHVELRGSCNQHFHEVKEKFSAMIQNDRDGAALTVLLNGKMVVNLYGGYSDRSSEKVWNSDTMTLAYSSTKIWAGLVAAILASQGHLNYDRRITSFWPEFGRNSKEDLTIRDVLDHRVSL